MASRKGPAVKKTSKVTKFKMDDPTSKVNSLPQSVISGPSMFDMTRNRYNDRLHFTHDMTKDIDHRTSIHFKSFLPFGFKKNSISTEASTMLGSQIADTARKSQNPLIAKMETPQKRKLVFAFDHTPLVKPELAELDIDARVSKKLKQSAEKKFQSNFTDGFKIPEERQRSAKKLFNERHFSVSSA